MDEVGLARRDDSGHGPIVQGKQVAVAAIEALAPAGQGDADVFNPAPDLMQGQVRVGDPDDHRAPALKTAGRLVDEQLRRPAPDGGDRVEFRGDQGRGGPRLVLGWGFAVFGHPLLGLPVAHEAISKIIPNIQTYMLVRPVPGRKRLPGRGAGGIKCK